MEAVSNSRVKNTKRNIVSGLIKQIVVILFPFIIRTIILYVLGAEYQGLNGLFSSVLQVLNLTDLGFTTAVTFIMYKPIAEGDNDTLCAILAYLKKVYRTVGLTVLILGLALTPFLRFMISGDVPADINIYILFMIYLLNAVVSYFVFAYKSALFSAMQREDIISNIYTAVGFLIKLAQIVLLLLFRNYYIFIIFLPIGSVLNNILLGVFSKKYFHDISPKGKMSNEIKEKILKQVKAIFIGRLGDVSRNSFDNIVLAALFGLVVVAVYSNYFYIFSALYGVMLVITHAMQASVGNSLVKESKEKNYSDFLKFTFIFMWLTGWCTVCMVCLYQPFMFVWMQGDNEMLLSVFNMILFCIYFYCINMNNTRNLYTEGYGLHYECRFYFFAEAIGNLLLNFLMGYFFGVTGILLATIITIFVFNFIARTNVLFKHYFKNTPKKFYLQHVFYVFVTVISAAITYFVCSLISLDGIPGLLVKGLICCILPNVIYIMCYFKTDNFRNAKKLIKAVLSGNKGN